MKNKYLAAIAALSLSASAFAANDGAMLFKNNNCTQCHAAAGKSLGPALADISARYKGDKGAQPTLEAKVRSGGAGSFGKIPMVKTPPTVSDGDIRIMVKWILEQK